MPRAGATCSTGRRVRGEVTVLFSTRVLADVKRIRDRVGILAHRRLVVEGPLAALLER